jgi:hypothetical protein
MKKFAIIEENIVTNIIICDSKELAEQITEKVCIEITDQPADIGGTYDGTNFIPKKPFNSWILDSNNQWTAPVEYPAANPEEPTTGTYVWDEETISWQLSVPTE